MRTTLICIDCNGLFEVPEYIANGGEHSGMPTYDTVSPCCNTGFTENVAQLTFAIPEEEYYALMELAQLQLRNSLDLIKDHTYSPMSLIEIKESLKQQAINAGLNVGEWWNEFENDLNF